MGLADTCLSKVRPPLRYGLRFSRLQKKSNFFNLHCGSVRRVWDLMFISVESFQTLFRTSRLGLVDIRKVTGFFVSKIKAD